MNRLVKFFYRLFVSNTGNEKSGFVVARTTREAKKKIRGIYSIKKLPPDFEIWPASR